MHKVINGLLYLMHKVIHVLLYCIKRKQFGEVAANVRKRQNLWSYQSVRRHILDDNDVGNSDLITESMFVATEHEYIGEKNAMPFLTWLREISVHRADGQTLTLAIIVCESEGQFLLNKWDRFGSTTKGAKVQSCAEHSQLGSSMYCMICGWQFNQVRKYPMKIVQDFSSNCVADAFKIW
jgi:hypothetical protein